ncbi:MAG: GNAT family N-acetyltransferase [Defluviitaleaceae bacterium]|nr:GNAT family N-acetyltransferase [Defluviitaleaceae bacterium]MCL2276135.1 GNAT family N-acetyltransferase [Defluviitaleaceae bacterium]
MQLIFPSAEFKHKAIEYKQEFYDVNEKHIDGSCGFSKYDNFDDWLEDIINIQKEAPAGFVTCSTYFAVIKDEVIGMISIRHTLNDTLRFDGGHIGYSVRPSQRRRGYATQMLALALEKCHELEINPVLITCLKTNIASAKTIINNGGKLDSEFIDAKGATSQRYWILR